MLTSISIQFIIISIYLHEYENGTTVDSLFNNRHCKWLMNIIRFTFVNDVANLHY